MRVVQKENGKLLLFGMPGNHTPSGRRTKTNPPKNN
jgi:hypothetical protein